ncbi:tape measure protein [Rhodospirillum sp. A1_3_36]|uniref:tape measure protein n=1 Tax=Rhodospirillum sp. A1_3_36 TaxID=3391666 RepID=UPI0039A53C5A
MAANVEDILLRIEADTTRLRTELGRADDRLDDFDRRTRRRLRDYDTAWGRAAAGVERVLSKHGLVITASAVAAGAAISKIAKAGDEYNKAVGKIAASTGSLNSAKAVFDQLAAVSSKTGVAMKDTAGSFVRFSIAAKQIGATNNEVIRLVETVQKLGAVSGASGQELSAGAMQLGQALASGRLQGDELKSILENMPKLAELLAAELGVSIGQLRKMGSEGELSADRIFKALLKVSNEADRLFSAMPTTIAAASGALSNSWDRLLVKLDDGLGLSKGIAHELQSASKALDAITGMPRSIDDQIASIEEKLQGGRVRGPDALRNLREQLADLKYSAQELPVFDAYWSNYSDLQAHATATTEAHTKALEAFGVVQQGLLTPMERAIQTYNEQVRVINEAAAAGADATEVSTAMAAAQDLLTKSTGSTQELDSALKPFIEGDENAELSQEVSKELEVITR